ncbi:MAG TPA: prephenate dehydrogenase/arogenate dehydrogenase family protein [Desulfobulbaceae bacterium]|nr:prephenate dehydrogenase/arogenate dehydrogenase family protein [Desulfobulbaceae bacterium]
MLTIATVGPEKSHSWLAASRYAPGADIALYPHTSALIEAFIEGQANLIVVPIYNTREGENKPYFRLFEKIKSGYWVDNIVLPVDLSLGALQSGETIEDLTTLIGSQAVFKQCEEYLGNVLPDVTLMGVHDVKQAVRNISRQKPAGFGAIDGEKLLTTLGLGILERDVAPHNRTRYAVLGPELAVPTGYDATVLITEPLDDRVGMLVDILGEFTRRGINILDMRSENDIKTQKLQVYIEIEGHIQDDVIKEAVRRIENRVIQQMDSLRLLGSFPRVDMRTKYIKSFGFIGTGAMSTWFADRLENEGYHVLLSGRSTKLRPEDMISEVDVLVLCVPISATVAAIQQYGPLLTDGMALILLAGESETTVTCALEVTSPGVEVMLVHNLWGPQAATMKDKNAIVVRTSRSGRFCGEFEAFLYKHGADIYHDSPNKHDLLMGVGQKLPTVISVALAMTLEMNNITAEDIAGHCTLTSLYPILAMARVHAQNPRTYAEIMATSGEGRKIVRDFSDNLKKVIAMADASAIGNLTELINLNVDHLTDDFIRARMEQAKAVDEVLGRMV